MTPSLKKPQQNHIILEDILKVKGELPKRLSRMTKQAESKDDTIHGKCKRKGSQESVNENNLNPFPSLRRRKSPLRKQERRRRSSGGFKLRRSSASVSSSFANHTTLPPSTAPTNNFPDGESFSRSSENRLKTLLLTPVRTAKHRISGKAIPARWKSNSVSFSPHQSSLYSALRFDDDVVELDGSKEEMVPGFELNDKDKILDSPGSNSLKTFLKSKENLESFRRFLKQEFSDENLQFWLEVEKYKEMKQEKRKKKANWIFNTFLASDALREVNIDNQAKKALHETINHPEKSTFDEAQRQVLELMERDPYPRFLINR